MFFLHLQAIATYIVALGVLASACACVWLVRSRRNLVRIPAILFSSPIAVFAALFIVLQLLSLGCESTSAPVYSPSHTKLVRLSTFDGGALGGSSALELLTHHGFVSRHVYRGGWKSVDIPKDVRWLDEDHLIVHYDPYQFLDCTSTRSTEVQCSVKQPPIPSGRLASPDGYAVAELYKANDGTYEGTDTVVLAGKVGNAYAYVGAPNSVVWEQTRWLSGRHLQIATKGSVKACADQIGITVTCAQYATR